MASDVVIRMHYHDNDGQPDQLEVVEAPYTTLITLEALRSTRQLHIHGGTLLVFGTPGLGHGRVGYQIAGWSDEHRALRLLRVPAAEMPQDCEDCDGE